MTLTNQEMPLARRMRRFKKMIQILLMFGLFFILVNYISTKSGQWKSNLPRGHRSIFYWMSSENTIWPWNTSATVNCPKINFYNYPQHRQKTFIDCNMTKPTLKHTYTNSPSDVQVLQQNSTCLLKFIQNSCYDNKTVPNIVHYIWYSRTKLSVFSFVSLISVVRFVQPCLIVFHGSDLPRGDLWNLFLSIYPDVIHINTTMKASIYGNKFTYREHAYDVMRIEILHKYGGIYLDWDTVILKPINKLRVYPFTMGLEKAEHLGCQVMLAAPHARFLKLWLNGYRNYFPKWDFNSIEYPFLLSQKYPSAVHIERNTLIKPKEFSGKALWYGNSDWSRNYALHLYLRGYQNKYNDTIETIKKLNTTIGAVSRHVLFGRSEICNYS